MASFQIGLGGRRIFLTPRQEQIAQDIARRAFSGRRVSRSGIDSRIIARSGFLLSGFQRTQHSSDLAFAKRQRVREIEQAKQQSLVGIRQKSLQELQAIARNLRTKKVSTSKAFDLKWNPFVRKNRFVGNSQQFSAYKSDIKRLKSLQIIQRGRASFSEALAKRKLAQQRKSFLGRVSTEVTKAEKAISGRSVGRAIDFITGGGFTTREFSRKQSFINEKIESFNRRFSGRDLSPEEFKQAEKEETEIKNLEADLLEETKAFDKTTKAMIKRVVFTDWWGVKDKKIEYPQIMKKAFVKLEEFNVKKQERIVANAREGVDKNPSAINTRKLKNANKSLSSAQSNLAKLNRDINPYSSPSTFDVAMVTLEGFSLTKASKIQDVKFVGKQTIKGNKILTDLAFSTKTGRIGIARGVTIQIGSGGRTVVLGKSGLRAIKLPSGKSKLLKQQVFAGIEKTQAIRSKLKIQSKVKFARGQLDVVRRNLQGFKQLGVGRIATVRGKKFFHTFIRFPSGKISQKMAKGINLNNFISISASLTKKNLSLIIGKAITSSRDKIRFMGLIQGSSGAGKVFKLSKIQKLQYAKALQNVISVASASLSKADKVSGLNTAQKLALATNLASKSAQSRQPVKIAVGKQIVKKKKPVGKPKPVSRSTTKVRPKQITKAKAKQIQKQKAKTKQQISSLTNQQQNIQQRIKQLQKQQQKTKQKTKQKTVQRTLQQQGQKLRQKMKTLTAQKAKLARVSFTPVTISPVRPRLVVPLPKKKKTKKPKKISPTKQPAFDVFARPLKKKGAKKKPKLLKVNLKPLTKSSAQDLRNFVVDQSLGRTGTIKLTTGKPKSPKVRVPSNYARITSAKFRSFRQVRGKRIPLRKGTKIERGKHLLDTKSEKRGITVRRRISQLHKQSKRKTPARRKTKRTMTSSQRATMLRNLEKARKVRKNNLGKRR